MESKMYKYEYELDGKIQEYFVSAEDEAEAEYWFLYYLKEEMNIKLKIGEVHNKNCEINYDELEKVE